MIAKNAIVFGLGILVLLLGSAWLSVYKLDQFEAMWGKGISFQVLTWIATLEALIGALGFYVGSRALRARGRRWLILLAGVGSGAVLLGLGILVQTATSTTDSRQILAVVTAFFVSFAAAALFRTNGDLGIDV